LTTYLTEWDAWKIALVLAIAMLAAWMAGWRMVRSRPKELAEPPSKIGDAILALLGLLLAFTFSMSLVKHEQRRQMVIVDSNSIGDFYTCASLLDDPTRSELQSVIRQYVEHRLAMRRTITDEAALQRQLEEIRGAHARMQALVKRAVDGGTPTVVPLVNTLNEVTSSHAARLAAYHDRLPTSIVLLLVLTATISMVVMGRQQGLTNEWHPGTLVAYTLLVSMVVWVTIDLNQPQRGWITVSQEPLEQLLKGMDDG
jgi:hypothetical protein